MKKLFGILFAVVVAFVLVSCDSAAATYEIAIVTDVGQLNDGGFNQGTYEGAKAYAEANNKTYKYYQPANGSDAQLNDRIAAMRTAIENGAKIIVTPGYLQQTALETVAAENPDVKFIWIDGWANGQANVTAVSYKEEESGYLVGYAAVKDGYTSLGGTFGGGGANAACSRFAYGYVQGVKDAAEELETQVALKISFAYGSSFSASPDLKTQISGWYASGTQVVFACGGSMVNSVIAAAQENGNKKIIGVDVDQASLYEGIITSAVKGLSASVQKVLGEYYNGEWDAKLSNKCSNLGAADDATGIPTATSSWRFNTFTVEEYNTIFNKIKNGTKTVRNDIESDMNDAAKWTEISTSSYVTFTFE